MDAIFLVMKTKHAKTLHAVFGKPTSASVNFSDLEALVLAPGVQLREGAGSRVVFELDGRRLYPS
jgi:hypothetical protein